MGFIIQLWPLSFFSHHHAKRMIAQNHVRDETDIPNMPTLGESTRDTVLLASCGDETPTLQQHGVPTQDIRPPFTTPLYHGRSGLVQSHSRASSLPSFRSGIPSPSTATDSGMSARRDEYLVLRRELQRSSAIRRVNDARRHAIYLQDAADYALVQQQCAMVNSCVQDLATTQVSPASPEQVRMRVPRRTRRATHRPENANSVDPPPNYSPYDPHPFFDRAETESMPKHRRRSTIEMIETVCKDGLKVTTEKVGKSLAKGVGGAGKMAKDMPTMVKEVQVKLKVKRAKGKIRWLEKHKYLSRQERFLTQEITG